ncbi:CBS domain-containing protein, partial [Candidatus Desantisbacteria bacterium]|nr:CBS domain-containing protein [Candidatus Desantisbacteria bacterium]
MKYEKVLDIMTRGIISVHLDDSVRVVVETLAQNKIHAVAVVAWGGEVAGVISEIDILGYINGNIDKLTAEDIMCSDCIWAITPQCPLIEAAKMMREKKCHRLLVMAESPRNDVAIGILSASDIVAEMAKKG